MMGRKRQRQTPAITDEEERWKDAVIWDDSNGNLSIEMVGLDSSTGTIFARMTPGSDGTSVTLGKLVEVIISHTASHNQTNERHKHQTTPTAIAGELIRLGSVWILPKTHNAHPQNLPKFRRVFDLGMKNETFTVIRVHSTPARFPSSQDILIVDKDDDAGFVLVNKPGGCPSHATVDNAIENALAKIQTTGGYNYASVPQRLDTDTSGLLLIASRPQFASYVSRLLEQKTRSCNTRDLNQQEGENILKDSIMKRYRCLLGISTYHDYIELQRLESTEENVTHYLDVHSPAPKRFCKTLTDTDMTEATEGRKAKWQFCQLRILSVSKAYPVSQKLATSLWDDPPLATVKFVVQVEIQLLTGRTHQIRGQMAALRAPIVGDPLYDGRGSVMTFRNTFERATNRMALQCCAIKMPRPAAGNQKQKRLEPSFDEAQFHYHLENAWWTKYLPEHEKVVNND
jgi:23S rRNA-/tRNA-specific pseudouridylate synthase